MKMKKVPITHTNRLCIVVNVGAITFIELNTGYEPLNISDNQVTIDYRSDY